MLSVIFLLLVFVLLAIASAISIWMTWKHSNPGWFALAILLVFLTWGTTGEVYESLKKLDGPKK